MMPIEVRELVKHYGDVKAVDGITFSVKEGEIFGLLGPNGAGKTTTMRILSGLSKPTEGDALVAGLDVRRDSERIKKTIG